MATTPLESPLTSTGVELLVVVPSPSAPRPFQPQHLTAPAPVSAHASSSPALIATTPASSPLTSTGVELSVVVPLPSSPCWLEPQHLTAPAAVSAHVRSLPALIATTPLPSPITSTGVEPSAVVPPPS